MSSEQVKPEIHINKFTFSSVSLRRTSGFKKCCLKKYYAFTLELYYKLTWNGRPTDVDHTGPWTVLNYVSGLTFIIPGFLDNGRWSSIPASSSNSMSCNKWPCLLTVRLNLNWITMSLRIPGSDERRSGSEGPGTRVGYRVISSIVSDDLDKGLSWITVDPRVTSRGPCSSPECLSLNVRLWWLDVGATNEIKTLGVIPKFIYQRRWIHVSASSVRENMCWKCVPIWVDFLSRMWSNHYC